MMPQDQKPDQESDFDANRAAQNRASESPVFHCNEGLAFTFVAVLPRSVLACLRSPIS